MLNWIRCHSVGLFGTSFAFGAIGAALVAAQNQSSPTKLLSIGVMVCASALLITLLSRITIWCAKKFMTESLMSMRWHELTSGQFLTIGAPARIAFFAQHLGLFAAALGFGWLFLTMVIAIFRSN